MLTRTTLDTGWEVALVRADAAAPQSLGDRDTAGLTLPAAVPGDVLSELVLADLLPDPRVGAREAEVAWVGRSDWVYRRELLLGADCVGRTAELVFHGIDTVAEVRLDGITVLTTQNMHRTYRVPLGLVEAERRLLIEVELRAPAAHAEALMAQLGGRPNVYDSPAHFLRKTAYNFGWDWGPRLVTSGLWRRVELVTWSGARFGHVLPKADWDGSRGAWTVTGEIEWPALSGAGPGRGGPAGEVPAGEVPAGEVAVEIGVAGGVARAVVPPGETAFTAHLDDLAVEPWQPRGHGAARLYDGEVRLLTDDRVCDQWHGRVGFRRTSLRTDPGLGGEGFELVVNGDVIQVRGVNWIPADCFPARLTRERYAERLRDLVDAHGNLVRVWGGGLYEDDTFYDLCDELGLMVWQDFTFACAAYPEEEPFGSEVAAEAVDNVRRLVGRPSLVLWCGNNEVIEGYQSWDWQEPLDGRPWGWGFFGDLLPRIVDEVDGTRPYWPGSPYAGTLERPVNQPDHGTNHIWDVWNREDYEVYRSHRPRFAAEFGFQGPANLSTLREGVGAEELRLDSPVFQAHQKAIDGQLKLDRSLAHHFGVPARFEAWHYLAQVNQARAVSVGIEHLRSLTPWCSGTVWWQLNDCWPALSWSVVDYAGRRKPAWYALARAYAPRLLTVQPREDGLTAFLLNDTDEPVATELTFRLIRLDGMVVGQRVVPLTVAARSAGAVPVPPDLAVPGPEGVAWTDGRDSAAAGDVVLEVCADADVGAARAFWFSARDRELALDPAALEVTVRRGDGEVVLQLAARGVVRDLWVRADEVDPAAEVDQQLLTLLPGERRTVRIATAHAAAHGWEAPGLVVSVNSVLAEAREGARVEGLSGDTGTAPPPLVTEGLSV